MNMAVAIFGLVVGAVVPILLLAGHLSLDVHGFGAVTFAQSAWFIWLGVLLIKGQDAQQPA